ncbi:MAG: hypothetical protein IJX67_08325 [Oscillospiraceae bacterium]|nr:hypothetical protein [Oscillospiraceae bacterium]
MANQNNTNEAIETASFVGEAAAHTHIDFSTIDVNDPASVAGIDISAIDCTACLELYEAHFGEAEADNSGDLLAGIEFNPGNFVSNLGYMGTGMLGIFIVIALIMGVTTALNKAFSGKKQDEQ